MEKMVEFSTDSLRTAHHGYAAKLARTVVHGLGTRHWRMLDVVLEIARDEEIHPSIAVVVAKSRASRP